MKDYYNILGISDEEKKLSGQEFSDLCKKKYHSLALKYHPDRWANSSEEKRKQAEEKFKDIAEANEVLSDPNKRAEYDNGGVEFNFEGFDPMDIFMRMSRMGGMGGFESPFGSFFGSNEQRVKRGTDIQVEVEMTIEEAYRGGKRVIQIPRNETCSHCHGTGSEDGRDSKCPDCNGEGFISIRRNIAHNQIAVTRTVCMKCRGTGRIINKPCHKCYGSGLETRYVTDTIDLPGGLSDNMVVVIPEKGNSPEGGKGVNGNLRVVVRVKENDYFKMFDEMNVLHYEEVPFNEAILGFEREVKCLDGSKVTVKAPQLTKDGQSFIFKGKGMPNVNNNSILGDYAVVIKYKLPDRLTDKQKEMLKNFYK